MPNKAIEWSMLMEGYNDRYGTKYVDLREWLTDLNRMRGGEENAHILGVSPMSFYNKLRTLEIPAYKRGLGRKLDSLYIGLMDLVMMSEKGKAVAWSDTAKAFKGGEAHAYNIAAQMVKRIAGGDKAHHRQNRREK